MKAKAKKFAVVGSFATGKTTLCEAALSVRAQWSLVRDAGRDCPLPLNRQQTLASSAWIIGEQLNREAVAMSEGARFILCDRSPLDVWSHTVDLGLDDADPVLFWALREVVGAWSTTYDRVFLARVDPDRAVEADGVRVVDSEYRSLLEERLMRVLQEFGVSVQELPADLDERVATVVEFESQAL